MKFNVYVNVINYRLQVQILVFLPQSWKQENFQEWPETACLPDFSAFPWLPVEAGTGFRFCFSET